MEMFPEWPENPLNQALFHSPKVGDRETSSDCCAGSSNRSRLRARPTASSTWSPMPMLRSFSRRSMTFLAPSAVTRRPPSSSKLFENSEFPMLSRFLAALVALCLLAPSTASAEEVFEIKFGTLAPMGPPGRRSSRSSSETLRRTPVAESR